MSDESKEVADQFRESKDLDLCPITPDAPSPLARAADTAGMLLGILGGVGTGMTMFGSTFRSAGRQAEPGDTLVDVVLNMYHALQDTLPLSLGEILPDTEVPATALLVYIMVIGTAMTLVLLTGRVAGASARSAIDGLRQQWTPPEWLDARSIAGIVAKPQPLEGPDLPASPVSATDLQARFRAVATDYARVEADPEVMLEAPAIRDVEVPTTAAFHTALAHATTVMEKPGTIHELTAAVDALEDAWRTAMDTALHIGLQGLSTAEKRRAERLWETATAVTGVSDAERRAARDRVIAYLDQVVITLSSGETGHLSGTRVVDDHLAHVALAAPARLALTR
ncbi:MAG: hypothetical protein ACTHYO_14230 [Micrococcaceae bacterium]